MKKQPIKYYFKDCVIKYTQTHRNDDGTFSFTSKVVEDCLLIITDGKATKEYITFVGAEIKFHKTRVKSFKMIKASPIHEKEFHQLIREIKFQVFEEIEKIPITKIREERLKDYSEFPIIK